MTVIWNRNSVAQPHIQHRYPQQHLMNFTGKKKLEKSLREDHRLFLFHLILLMFINRTDKIEKYSIRLPNVLFSNEPPLHFCFLIWGTVHNSQRHRYRKVAVATIVVCCTYMRLSVYACRVIMIYSRFVVFDSILINYTFPACSFLGCLDCVGMFSIIVAR